MNKLICPISAEQVNKPIVRLTGFLVASMALLYAFTGNVFVLILLGVDFFIRAFSIFRFSPLSYIACGVATLFKIKPQMIDKAPKLFAARVGLIFTVTALLVSFISVPFSIGIMLVLTLFALMESLLDFCVGCVVYTYIVLPIHKRQVNSKA